MKFCVDQNTLQNLSSTNHLLYMYLLSVFNYFFPGFPLLS